MKRKHKTPVTAGHNGGTASNTPHDAKKHKSSAKHSEPSATASKFAELLGGEQVVTALLGAWEEAEPCYVEGRLTKMQVCLSGVSLCAHVC